MTLLGNPVRTGGGSRPVLLLHGLLGSARNLSTLARGLAERDASLDVIALDLTGHGASPPLPPDADSATLAADVLATARRLGVTAPLALVGHSLGGRVALAVASREPASIAAITLLDVAPGPFDARADVARVLDLLLRQPDAFTDRAAARAALVADALAPALADWLLLNLEPSDGRVRWRIDRHALAALHARMAGEDLWPVVESGRRWRLACVRGGASGYVSEHDARRLRAANAHVATIDGAGHFLHVERPREVLDAVLAGLAGTSPA